MGLSPFPPLLPPSPGLSPSLLLSLPSLLAIFLRFVIQARELLLLKTAGWLRRV